MKIDFKKLTTWAIPVFLLSFYSESTFYLFFTYYLSIIVGIGSNFIILFWPRILCDQQGLSYIRLTGHAVIHYIPPIIMHFRVGEQQNLNAMVSAIVTCLLYAYFTDMRKIYGSVRYALEDLSKLDRKPRILIISTCCPNMVNGITIRMKNIIRANKDKYDFKWVSNSLARPNKHKEIDADYLSAWEVPLYKDFGCTTPYGLYEAYKAFHKFKPDIVHAANAELAGLFLVLVAIFNAKKVTVSVHTDMSFIAKQKSYGFVFAAICRWLSLGQNWADVLATSSMVHAERLKEEGQQINSLLSFCPFDTNVFNNKVNKKKRAAMRKEWNGDRVLLSLGRISPEKSLEVVYQALKKSKNETGKKLTWVIVGDGPEREKWVSKHGEEISKDIYLYCMGKFIPHESTPDYYKAADVVIGASESETFGLTAVESRMCDKLFLARNSGGYLQSNAGGLFFNNQDDLAELIEKHLIIGSDFKSKINDLKSQESVYPEFAF